MNQCINVPSAVESDNLPEGVMFKPVIALVCAATIAFVIFLMLLGLARLREIVEKGIGFELGSDADCPKMPGETVGPFSTLADLDR
jgi:hypothetical protein